MGGEYPKYGGVARCAACGYGWEVRTDAPSVEWASSEIRVKDSTPAIHEFLAEKLKMLGVKSFRSHLRSICDNLVDYFAWNVDGPHIVRKCNRCGHRWTEMALNQPKESQAQTV